MDRNISSLLSLCIKAGMLVTGESAAVKLLKRNEAKLVVIAEDAAENTKKKFVNKCFFYRKPVRIFGERALLSKCVGKQNRTVYVITDDGFAARLQNLIDNM